MRCSVRCFVVLCIVGNLLAEGHSLVETQTPEPIGGALLTSQASELSIVQTALSLHMKNGTFWTAQNFFEGGFIWVSWLCLSSMIAWLPIPVLCSSILKKARENNDVDWLRTGILASGSFLLLLASVAFCKWGVGQNLMTFTTFGVMVYFKRFRKKYLLCGIFVASSFLGMALVLFWSMQMFTVYGSESFGVKWLLLEMHFAESVVVFAAIDAVILGVLTVFPYFLLSVPFAKWRRRTKWTKKPWLRNAFRFADSHRNNFKRWGHMLYTDAVIPRSVLVMNLTALIELLRQDVFSLCCYDPYDFAYLDLVVPENPGDAV